MGKVVSALLGTPKAPKPSTQPEADVNDAKRRAKRASTQRIFTGRDTLGQELNPSQVQSNASGGTFGNRA